MERNLLFFDIDGTLITEDGRRYLPDSARDAIQQTRLRGNLCFINTGRVLLNIEPFIRDIGFDGFVCGCGTYIQYHGQPLFHNRLPKKLCDDTALLARECRMYSLFESADKNGIDPELEQHPEVIKLKNHFQDLGREIQDFVGTAEFSFDKFTGWFEEDCDLERFMEGIKDSFTFIRRGEGFCEIVPKGFSKATGIDFLCDYFQIPLERCYAFGDSTNDLSMLLHVPNSIGMANGMKEVLDVVSYITSSVEDNGLHHAMEHFQLI